MCWMKKLKEVEPDVDDNNLNHDINNEIIENDINDDVAIVNPFNIDYEMEDTDVELYKEDK